MIIKMAIVPPEKDSPRKNNPKILCERFEFVPKIQNGQKCMMRGFLPVFLPVTKIDGLRGELLLHRERCGMPRSREL